MLFNSYIYILAFFPACFFVYFFLNGKRLALAAKAWLALASLFFYGWWDPRYVPLLLGSILFNYGLGTALGKFRQQGQRGALGLRAALYVGIVGNLLLLGYFKYLDFFLENLNLAAGASFELQRIVLPLGISFFTFTQIAYLVDASKGQAKEYDFLNYVLFVTFFPHLLAGPILHHKEMMPQFDRLKNKIINPKNISLGLYLFFIGLFKKAVIADEFAAFANHGFDLAQNLSFLDAWAASLAYTLQIYYDFSGYTDMALGSALILNIRLPVNFNSPYKAKNIQDFWRRWHMTLSRFLRDYVYIPLGGNRAGNLATYRNLFLTFLIGGIWHGAGWTFIIWGALHGFAVTLHRWFVRRGWSMPGWLGWFLTFNFVNLAWVFFRAKDLPQALKVLSGMFGLNGLAFPAPWETQGLFASIKWSRYGTFLDKMGGLEHFYLLAAIGLGMAFWLKNSNKMTDDFQPGWRCALFLAPLTVYALLNVMRASQFIYFQF